MEVNAELRASLLPVVEITQIGEARRLAARLASALGFSDIQSGKVGIIATELATNLVKHARKGEFLVQAVTDGSGWSVEMIATDTGPGVAQIERCLQDGYSTAGTAGQGLGAIVRQSSEFDIHSTAEFGTVVMSRVAAVPTPPGPPAAVRWGGVAIPAPGEIICGDCWRVERRNGDLHIVLADGLGHGPLAAEASELACAKFDAHAVSPDAAMRTIHSALTSTRGAAVAIATIQSKRRVLQYAGIGNIAGTLLGPGTSRGLFSHNGIVGKQMRTAQLFEYPWPAKGVLVMASDGIQSRWSLDRYPGLINKHPSVIAATLARDFKRGRDDVGVIVASIAEQVPHG